MAFFVRLRAPQANETSGVTTQCARRRNETALQPSLNDERHGALAPYNPSTGVSSVSASRGPPTRRKVYW